ncbi:MAG: hypothetical protein H7211_09250 [Aquabacterium sp.]|nr:hypothetical protein [Ferruginibacter sp.]
MPLLIIFLIFSASLPLARPLLAQWGINSDVLIVANILFFAVSLIAFFMQQKALQNINPNVFVRSVMAGMLIKMFVCITAVIIYRLVAGNNVSKVSVFAAMFLYLLYLAVEVAVITKLNKQKNA